MALPRYVYVIFLVVAFCALALTVEAIVTNTNHWSYIWEYYTGDTRPVPSDYFGPDGR